MYAYQRPDGRYDLYHVAPEVISAEEYESLKHREELEQRKAALLAELAHINAELGEQKQVSTPVSTPAPENKVFNDSATAVTPTANVEQPVIRKRW